jgi:hypothetical protein
MVIAISEPIMLNLVWLIGGRGEFRDQIEFIEEGATDPTD